MVKILLLKKQNKQQKQSRNYG